MVSEFQATKSVEATYARALRSVAKEISKMVKAFPLDVLLNSDLLEQLLNKYSKTLEPWAIARANTMLASANRTNKNAWKSMTKELSKGVQEELKSVDVGARYQELMDQQVELITSLPKKAAERVHKLATESLTKGGRYKEIAKEIYKTGEVTQSRAELIARTEVARASSVFTRSRAESIGSEGYIWRTSRDARVRDSHAKMNGKFVRWDDPPTLDGMTGHAGTLPNCRCHAEPVIPEELFGDD